MNNEAYLVKMEKEIQLFRQMMADAKAQDDAMTAEMCSVTINKLEQERFEVIVTGQRG